jgi:hypothetical protein
VMYVIIPSSPPTLSLATQIGPADVSPVVPTRVEYTDILGHVARTGQAKIIGLGDSPNHFLVERGRYGTAVVSAVGTTLRFGVIIAFREQAQSIKQDSIVMLELITAQLASALAKDQRG